MLDWNAAKEAIRQAVIAATGVTSTSVVWANRSEGGTWTAYPTIELKLRRFRGFGDDATLLEIVSDALVSTTVGPREAQIEIKILSDNQNDYDAGQIAELLRTRIVRASVLAALKTALIGLGQIFDTVEADYQDTEGRMLSVSIMEIRFNLLQIDVDTTADDGFIEHIRIVSDKLTHSPGVDALTQFDVTVDKATP